MKRKAQSDLISTVVISAVILVAGIALWVFFSGYAFMTRLSAQEEVDKELKVLRSAISADFVLCPRGEALIRNIGKEPVVIFRLIVLKNGEVTWDSFKVHGIKALSRLDIGGVSNPPVRFVCPTIHSKEDVVTVQFHYIPESLFNPSYPELIDPTPDVLLFRVATFKVEETSPLRLNKVCHDIPTNWAWIDFVDPEDSPPYGSLGQRIGLRLPEASNTLLINLKVEVKGSSGTRSATGSVISISEETQWINIDLRGLRYPVTIRFETNSSEDMNVLQNEWYFDAMDNSYVNYVKLLWNRLDEKVVGSYVSVFHRISGTYRVVVKLIDCNNEETAVGYLEKDVVVGAAGRWEEYAIAFSSSETMSNVRRIEVFVEDISDTVVVTEVKMVSLTETVTKTLTSWITKPVTTLTKIDTTTVTTTTVIPTTTFTTTKTVTSTSTTLTTTTVTSTSTRTRSTTTSTTTVTATSTMTTYLSTVTITRTTTVGTTTTIYSTRTTSTILSIPTTTQTVTSTSTLTTTVPTTTVTNTRIVTVTATTTPPVSTSTITATFTSTVSTTTLRTTKTIGSTVTLITTQTATVTTCPISGSSKPIDIMLVLGTLTPFLLTSIIIRRCRR